jgi:hypothetical protein
MVEVLVWDAQGGSSKQTYQIVVGGGVGVGCARGV